MLIDRLDVPYLAPQLMAFAVERTQLEQLVSACDDALEHGDNAALVALWEEHSAAYASQLARMRWRVPRATFVRIADSVQRAEHVRRAPEPLRRAVEASLRRAGAHFTEGHAVVIPARWFELEDSYEVLLGAAARTITSMRDLAIESFADAVDRLDVSSPEALRGPRGDLGAARTLCFYSEDDLGELGPEETSSARDYAGGPNALEMRSSLSAPLPLEARERHLIWTGDAVEAAHRAIAFEDVLRVLVGPYRVSLGPGPFLGPPHASRAFGPPRQRRLPIFRVGSSDVTCGWRWLAPHTLGDARREVQGRQEPDVGWWGEARDWVTETDRSFAQRGRGEWQPWSESGASFQYHQERFAELLRSAEQQEQGVVLLPNHRHCDLDGPGRPRTSEWGEPVRIPASCSSRSSSSPT